jgi:hypothetical protein
MRIMSTPTDDAFPPTDDAFPPTDDAFPPTDDAFQPTDDAFPPTDGRGRRSGAVTGGGDALLGDPRRASATRWVREISRFGI